MKIAKYHWDFLFDTLQTTVPTQRPEVVTPDFSVTGFVGAACICPDNFNYDTSTVTIFRFEMVTLGFSVYVLSL